MAQATNEQLLEAAKSGDYSEIMNTPDRYGQIPANMTSANEQLRQLQNQGAQLLKQENAMKGVTTGDYSGASKDAPMLLAGSNYNKVFQDGKGYAVYDSVTEADGTQYLAVAGKNSSFIQQINPDGTTERVASPPKASSMGINIGKTTTASGVNPGQYGSIKSGTRGKNINRVLGAFEDFKSTLDLDKSEDVVVEDPIVEEPIVEEPVVEKPVVEEPVVEEPVLNPIFSGEDFVSVTPPTDVINVGAGEVAPIDPNVSQTVNQAVAPVNYQTTATTGGSTYVSPTVKNMTKSITSPTTGYVAGNVAPQAPVTGTFTQPSATAGMSAVPASIMYKTQYAGTQGAVPQGTVATAPGTGQNIQSGYEQHPYINRQTTQEVMVTEFNGQPITYVPPGFVRKFARSSASTQATSVDPNVTGVTNMAVGGDVDRDTILAKRFLGFEGSPSELEGFLASNPGASSRMSMYRSAMGRQNPNVVPNETNIAGQPHRLAYVNPQEEKLLEAAGGAGVPSYGGIPTYFTLGPGTTVGETATDPTTGTKYTWNGTSWDITLSSGESGGTTPGLGGTQTQTQTAPAGVNQDQFKAMQQGLITQTMQPIQGGVAGIIPNAYDFIPVDAGMTVPQAPFAEAATAGSTTVAGQPILPSVQTASTTATQPDVKTQTDSLTAQTLGTLTQDITGQTQDTSSVSGLDAATSTARTVQDVAGQAGVPRRTLDTTTGDSGEVVSGSAVDQARVGQAFGTGEVQAASVQDELASLMSQFDDGQTPAWAAGSMRRATAIMAERGLGASSMAGQAIVQAAMEAALPIAQIDAGNKQQVALFKAEQRAKFLQIDFDQAFQAKVINAARVSEIANMNFNADQQIALENSRAANTMDLANLNNRQALLLSEAAALANLDMASLSNLQQAQVQNAQNFLQMDMANLNNRQQTEIFKTQQNIASILSDSAADNAAEQFNAQSENQRNQFFSNLSSIVSQFNASQANAMDQFNLNNVNSLRKFNSEMQQQRDLFNAQNGLVIAQANAKWRQNIATLNTAAQNESNMDFAKTINALSAKNLDEIWQRERDIMSNAFVASQSAADRALQIVLGDKELEAIRLQMETKEDIANTEFGIKMLFPNLGTGGGLFPS
jgi:hypothetical protein